MLTRTGGDITVINTSERDQRIIDAQFKPTRGGVRAVVIAPGETIAIPKAVYMRQCYRNPGIWPADSLPAKEYLESRLAIVDEEADIALTTMKAVELREVGAGLGLEWKAVGMPKAAMIADILAARERNKTCDES